MNKNERHSNTSRSNNPEVNREKVCPFLLKVFYRENDFNDIDDMSNGIFPTNRELHLYTWMDASLREISMLIKDALEIFKKKEAQLIFSLVYRDYKGRLQRKELGYVYTNKKSHDDNKTLQNYKFNVGDILDIQINTK